MPIRRFIKILDCHDAANIPDDIPLSGPELAAFRDPQGTFLALSKKCRLPSLKHLLKLCASAHFEGIELDAFDEVPQHAHFRFYLEKSAPAIRLPRRARLAHLPPILQDVYRAVGGIQDDDFKYTGSFCTPDSVCPITDAWFWLTDEQELDISKCFLCLSTFCGDYYGFDDRGRAIRYNHEIGKVQPAGKLKDLLDRYFNSFIVGEKI